MDWSRTSVLAIAAILLLVGGVRIYQEGEEGHVFLATGFIMLGIWAAVELHDRWHKDKEEDNGESGTGL